MGVIAAKERNFYLRTVGYVIAAIALAVMFIDIENIIELASHLFKFIALIVFLVVVVLFNLNKGYQAHKPTGEPFNLNEFFVYSKNRISEFFGVARNVYIAFSIVAVLFSAVAFAMFMVKAEEKGDEAKASLDETLGTINELKDTQAQQMEVLINSTQQVAEEAAIKAAKRTKEEICADVNYMARAATGICSNVPRSSARAVSPASAPTLAPQPDKPQMPTVTVTAPPAVEEPLTFAPSSPLSGDDVTLEKVSKPIYEARPFTINPKTE